MIHPIGFGSESGVAVALGSRAAHGYFDVASWGAPRSRRSGKRKKRREGGGKVGRRGSPVKAGRGRKRRGGRKREEERTPEAVSQVDKLAAGETLRSSPCGAATSLSSPCSL